MGGTGSKSAGHHTKNASGSCRRCENQGSDRESRRGKGGPALNTMAESTTTTHPVCWDHCRGNICSLPGEILFWLKVGCGSVANPPWAAIIVDRMTPGVLLIDVMSQSGCGVPQHNPVVLSFSVGRRDQLKRYTASGLARIAGLVFVYRCTSVKDRRLLA